MLKFLQNEKTNMALRSWIQMEKHKDGKGSLNANKRI